MSTPINDGGPAFPSTLRDWFAGQALAGICAQNDGAYWPGNSDDVEGIAKWRKELHRNDALTAYEYADAMLAAREVKP